MTFWALRAGVLTGGGGLLKQYEQGRVYEEQTCPNNEVSGPEKSARSAVATPNQMLLIPVTLYEGISAQSVEGCCTTQRVK